MGKKAREQGIPNAEMHKALHTIAKKSSHGGNKPLVESLTNPNVMVTQKVRKAQERRRAV
tara:strand:- start:4981 stop:5160 length:180 start_codon:yes stop_codon:yes gene_type:complete